jgi:phosphatidylglycerol:prolipoprotein diacylglycerol transferase
LPNQHFHLYLVAYGLFRFTHEFWRDTPQVFGPLSGYQIAALLLVMLGGVGFWRRAQSSVKSATEF